MLEVRDIQVSFITKQNVLAGISFIQCTGEVVALLGPSGCGKSTLLAVVAGLIQPDSGVVYWQGKDLAGVPTHRREFGLMFQDYALFPHMPVGENIAFGLKMQGLTRQEIEQQVSETLALVGLPGYERRDVNQLSGGEQQRVALGRALAPRPKLLMLDEPLGSLDRALRQRLMDDLRQIVKSTAQTTLYVTHDQEEAYTLADRVVVMQAGQAIQIGTPQEIYLQPASVFVARFVGLTNFVSGQAGEGMVNTPMGQFPCNEPYKGPVMVLFRPDRVRLEPGELALNGTVTDIVFQGETSLMKIKIEEHSFSFSLPSGNLPHIGEEVALSLDAERGIQIFPPENEHD
jgi:ABC-type Fe3+/spermidine/putrescine transport system ATPase subunit